MTVAGVIVQIVLSVFGTAWIVRRDMARLSPERLARTWNDASLWCAVVAFGPLCLPVHFLKSRRTLGGAALGLLWMVAATAVFSLVASAVDWLVS
jgi:hypothetical protein